jgi:hypothetical protein
MGATSVTGKGVGIANNEKGPGNNRNYFVPEITPHVVAAGSDTLSSSTKRIYFPHALAGASTEYAVIITPTASITALGAFYVIKHDNTSGELDYFTVYNVYQGESQTFDWAVIKSGLGLDLVSGL